jgi:hypothetical protein
MKLYVVTGFAGEYSDKYEWVEGAFTDEAAANAWAERANGKIKEAEAAFTAAYEL